METHINMPRFFFLCDLTESSCSSFTAVLLLVSDYLVYFFPLVSSGTFLHLLGLPLFHPSMQSFFESFFQGLKIRIISSDLIGSVVQIYFCQYFHWPHHRKQLHCILENSIYVRQNEIHLYF